MEIEDLPVRDYCQKMKSTADLLSNVGTPVNDRILVMYIINGLNEKFDNIINVIKHKDPFPTYDSAKSMLEWEETRVQKSHRATASHTANSSSSTALTVSSPQQPRHTSNRNRNGNQRGNRRGGRGNNRGGRGNFSYNQTPWGSTPFWAPPPPHWLQQYHTWPQVQQQPSAPQQQAHLVQFPMQGYTSESIADLSTTDWLMDSGATSHLATSTGMLQSTLNRNTN